MIQALLGEGADPMWQSKVSMQYLKTYMVVFVLLDRIHIKLYYNDLVFPYTQSVDCMQSLRV